MVSFDWAKVKSRKKFVKLKGNGELFVIKAYWRIYPKNNVKLANFWSVLTGLSSKVEKKFVKLKGNREFFVIKAYWRIYPKNNVKLATFWSVLTGLSSKFEKNRQTDENFSWKRQIPGLFQHFQEFCEFFDSKAPKLQFDQKYVKIGPRWSLKANFCLSSLHFRDFFV